jgi:DNA-binding NarL/FixJ family response regulator
MSRTVDRAQGGETTVVVVEGHYFAREGILRMLELLADVRVVGVCEDVDAARAAVATARPDVVITNVRMRRGLSNQGLQLAAELRLTHPAVAVLVLSREVEPRYAAELLADGCDRRGYLLTERLTSHHDMGLVIRQLARGGSYLDPAVAAPFFEPQGCGVLELTHRELQILGDVACGASDSTIAASRGISTRTVTRAISTMYAKLRLPQDPQINRRVKAALLFHSATEGAGRPEPHGSPVRLVPAVTHPLE